MVIVWKSSAQEKFYQQIEWYRYFRGEDFVRSFYENVTETVAQIAVMPSIGRLERTYKTKAMRSFLTHPRCRIYYKYNEEVVEIVRLYFNSKENG